MKLTQRQRQVVELLAVGLSCPAIARRLGVSVRTVRHHIEHVADKLDANPDVPALRRVRNAAAILLSAA